MTNQPTKWVPPAVVKPVDSELVPMQVGGRTLSVEELRILKGNLAPKALNAEFLFFILYCERFTLDPFGDAYLITRNDKNSDRGEKSIIQLGINAYRKRAIESGAYEGREGPFWKRKGEDWVDIWEYEDEVPFAARVKVYRTNCRVPFVGTALWSAYGKGTSNKSIWDQFGPDQLAKVAEKKALEAGFTQLSHAYIDEEMRQMGARVDVEIHDLDGEAIEGTLAPSMPTATPTPQQETPIVVTSTPTAVESSPSLLIAEEDITALTNMYNYLGVEYWPTFLSVAGVRSEPILAHYTPDECTALYAAWDPFLASPAWGERPMSSEQTNELKELATTIKGLYPPQINDVALKRFRTMLIGTGKITVVLADHLLAVYREIELVLSLAVLPNTEGIFDENLQQLRTLMAPSGNVLDMWLAASASIRTEYLVSLYGTMSPEMIVDEALRVRFVSARDELGLTPVEEPVLA